MKEKIEEQLGDKLFHYLSMVGVAENGMTDVEVLRVGTIQDRGFKITQAMLDEFVQNFKANVYGTEIQVNLEHFRGSAAAGWITDLFVDKDKLYARVEWTEMGKMNIDKKLFKFVSAELASEYPHHETGKLFNNVFIGLALTNTPALKGQQPLKLEEDINLISKNMFAKLLEEMKKRSFVSKQDKEMVKSLLEELPAEEQEAQKEAVAEVEAKPEAPEKTEEEKAAEAKAEEERVAAEAAAKAAEGGQALKDKANTVSLAEFNNVKSQLDAIQLKEFMNENLLLSDKLQTGFANTEESSKELKSFLISLNESQRTQFAQLVAKVVTVDLSVHGSTSVGTKENKEFADQVVELSEKMLAEGKAKNITEAQKMATDELNSKK